MSDKVPVFYNSQNLMVKDICNRIKDVVLILKKQKDKIEMRQVRKSLGNYSENYEKK